MRLALVCVRVPFLQLAVSELGEAEDSERDGEIRTAGGGQRAPIASGARKGLCSNGAFEIGNQW